MRVALGLLLMLEGFASGVRLTRFAPLFAAYPPLTIGMLILRFGVGVLQFAGGWTLLGRRPVGPALARLSLLVSAVLTTIEIGFRLVPTSLFPTYRWPAVGLYWLYALAGAWLLKKQHDARL